MRIAAKVFECVNATERLICGAHAVSSPARAEGLAMAGQRAANLLTPAQGSDGALNSESPWVYHRLVDQPGEEIELVAGTGQEAVNHCLAAHLLANSVGRTVVCSLSPALAEELAIVSLPTPEQIREVMGGEASDVESAIAATERVRTRDASSDKGVQADDAIPIRLAVVPDDAFARRQLLAFVARIGGTGDLRLSEDGGDLVVSRGGVPEELPELADLLLVCGPVDELPGGWDERLRPKGIVLQVTSGDMSHGGWEILRPELLNRLRDGQFAFWHFEASQAADEWADALVEVGGECIKRLRLPVSASKSTQRPQRVSLDELVALPTPPAATGLTMPVPGQETTSDLSPEIRHFHLCGRGGPFAVEPLPGQPLHPASLTGWAKPSDREWPFPMVLPAARPLHELLTAALIEVDVPKTEREVLRGELWRVCRQVLGRMETTDDQPPMHELVGESAQVVVKEFDAGSEGRQRLESTVEALVAKLPTDGRLLRLDQTALLDLYTDRVRRNRKPALQQLCVEARTILIALEARLEADRLHGGEGKAPSHLQASVGAVGTSLLDLNALSESLPPHRGSQSLPQEDRERVERIVSELRCFLEGAEASPDVCQTDRFAVAVGLFDGLAATYLPVFRAVRAGRLEVEGRYDPGLHAEALERLDVAVLTEDELEALPRVVVVTTEAAMQEASLKEFSQVLQSGRPIHALILRRLTDGGADTDSFYPGLSYVSIAHREAYVFQGLLADPGELVAGLDGMMNAQRPSVAFIGAPGQTGSAEWHWIRAETARQGRAAPQFSFDPEKGLHWAERFDLSHNPQPDQTWPTLTVSYTDESGLQQTIEERFTFAHAAALEPAYRRHFRILPRDAWSDDQWPVADYLDAMIGKPPDAIPYLWVVSDDGELKRAVMTRELALRCRDRMRFWTLLQELAGINNEHVRAAVELAQAEAEQQVEALRAELEQAHARDLEKAREDESAATVDRLVAALMQTDGTLPPLKVTPPSAPTPAPEPDPEPTPEPEPVADEEISLDEPYIETFRCTTCDECTQLNPRMFAYNEDKQAILTDLDAGSFADLVIAAEKCPADCIFPGIPRNGDPTATPEMMERARAL